MGGIFNMDGPLFRFGNAIADVMILSLLWILFSIPLFTIGASTTALFYVATRRISDREGYLFRDFLSSFKSNFKRATALWILWLIMFVVILLNIRMLMIFEFETWMITILMPIHICILIELILTAVYLYPLTARFEMGFKQTIKSAFFMANRHIFTTVTCLLTGVSILIATVILFEPIIIVGMGLYAYISSYMIMRVFKKYRPEMDENQMTLEPLRPLPDISTKED
ncbi:MAG: DUF624 domain-containing protein [Defluviitaleaceae bacterium]|nr:DUF624 domain-containing protein [Defluviitaleaceae bacterium]